MSTLGFCDGADGAAIVTVVVVLATAAAIVEVEVVRTVGVAGMERTGPVFAERALKVEAPIVSVARSREKNRIAVPDTDEFVTFDGRTIRGGYAGPVPAAVG